ncbi:hypothetical protein E2C01_057738 [Portunus trituberculatus]|uniref:Uncharacterized protein n=1 Tax=Portunus trituberculatus TaxID=210409 RepID=A0A5B7H2T4_PORTR|nr:hypothetical protein [Portunus trituberculatus]
MPMHRVASVYTSAWQAGSEFGVVADLTRWVVREIRVELSCCFWGNRTETMAGFLTSSFRATENSSWHHIWTGWEAEEMTDSEAGLIYASFWSQGVFCNHSEVFLFTPFHLSPILYYFYLFPLRGISWYYVLISTFGFISIQSPMFLITSKSFTSSVNKLM